MEIEQLRIAIAKKLREARKEQGLSQEDTAKQLGITTSAYGAFERAKNLIALDYLLQLPAILGKPLWYFLPYPNPINLTKIERLAADEDFMAFVEFWEAMSEEARKAFIDFAKHVVLHQSE